MARAKPQPKPVVKDVQYLNVDLTKEMKGSLIKWCEDNPNVLDLLEKALDSGLRFGASFDNYNECWQSQFTKLPPRGEAGQTLVLVGRGGSLFQAIQAVLFKYYVVLQEELEDGDIKNARGVTDWG